MPRTEQRLILGINCAYHESAAALVRDGEVVFAAEEERFTRAKHAKPRAWITPTSFRGMPSALAWRPRPGLHSRTWTRSPIHSCPGVAWRRSEPTRMSSATSPALAAKPVRRNSIRAYSLCRRSWPAQPAWTRSPSACLCAAPPGARRQRFPYLLVPKRSHPGGRRDRRNLDSLARSRRARRHCRDRGNPLPALDRHALGAGGGLSRIHGVRCLQGDGPRGLWQRRVFPRLNSIACLA